MSQSPARRRRREIERSHRPQADASLVIAVNVPSHRYEGAAHLVLQAIERLGYEAHAMTGEFILKMADDIRQQLAEARRAEIALENAINNKEN